MYALIFDALIPIVIFCLGVICLRRLKYKLSSADERNTRNFVKQEADWRQGNHADNCGSPVTDRSKVALQSSSKFCLLFRSVDVWSCGCHLILFERPCGVYVVLPESFFLRFACFSSPMNNIKECEMNFWTPLSQGTYIRASHWNKSAMQQIH